MGIQFVYRQSNKSGCNPTENTDIPVKSLSAPPDVGFDYISSGYLHDPERGTECGTKIQYLGSTVGISAKQNAMNQSAWLVRADAE